MYNMLGMSSTVFLPDGEQWQLYDTENDFARLIHDRLGNVAEHVFREILEENKLENYDEEELTERAEEAEAEYESLLDIVNDAHSTLQDIEHKIKVMLDGKISRIQLMEILREIERVESDLL